MAAATIQQLAQLIGKGIAKSAPKTTVSGTVASEAFDVARVLSRKSLGFDFVGLIVAILIIYGVSFFIDIFMKAKLFFDDSELIVRIGLGIFGIAGLLLNFFLPKETNPTKLTNNQFINDLFSDEGFKGFKFFDIVNIIVMVIIVATYFKVRSESIDSQGKTNVQPVTTALFIILFIAVSLVEIPSLVKRLKMTDLGIEAMR